jgi:hypothetical protein
MGAAEVCDGVKLRLGSLGVRRPGVCKRTRAGEPAIRMQKREG